MLLVLKILEIKMKDKDVLAIFKKHVDSSLDDKNKIMHSHRFGENMKGVNEFIGVLQTINMNLSKIIKLSEIIHSINDYSNLDSIHILNKQKHIDTINDICHASFLGINLFDTEFSCALNGEIFSICIESPSNYFDNKIIGFCIQKQDELNLILKNISCSLESQNANVNLDSNYDFKSLFLHN